MAGFKALIGAVIVLALSACTGYLPEGRTTPDQLSRAIIVEKVNAVRLAYGRKPLKYDAGLAAAAQRQADLMAQKDQLSHDLGETLRARVSASGFKGAVGENVAGGAKSLEAALTGWLQSGEHQHILLNANFTVFGLGVASVQTGTRSRYGTYWSIVLGGDNTPWLAGAR